MTPLRPVAGVIGWPVNHSLSPRLHRFWLDRAGIDGFYVPLPVSPDQIDAALSGLSAFGLRGVNVTVPHKEAVFERLHRLDPLTRRVGAVNTVVVAERGGLIGRNTDVAGFMDHLRHSAPHWTGPTGPAVILGAGGAARAAAVGLLDAGVPGLCLINRNITRAEALARKLDDPRVRIAGWQDRTSLLKGTALLVNTTSLGMTGQPPLDVELSLLPGNGVVYDIVYAPLETPLLAEARRRGLTAVDGLGMLIHQAVPAFEAFYGVRPDPDAQTRAHLVEVL